MPDYTILRIQDFDDHSWQDYFDFVTILRDKYHYHLSYESPEAIREEFTAMCKTGMAGNLEMVCAHGAMCAELYYRIRNRATPRQAAFVDIEILGESIPDAMACLMASRFADWLESIEDSKAMTYARDRRLMKVAEQLGGDSLGLRNEFALKRENLNAELIAEWMNEISAQNPDLRMEYFHEPPSEYFEEHARVLTTLLRDMPRTGDPDGLFCQVTADEIARDVERRRNGGQGQNIVFLFNEAGSMIGLSTAGHGADSDKNMHQGMSGLLPDYRGRGLAKWLKAATLDSLTKRFPDWEVMHTSMHEGNDAIVHINDLLGFEKVSEGCEYTLYRDKLKEIAQS